VLSLGAGAAIAASVTMHVAWNLLARHQPRESYPLWWVLLGHLLLLGPWGLTALLAEVRWSAQFVALLGTSAVANAAYFMALERAYRHAPVALVYPLVRSSPLLIAVWSTLFFSESFGLGVWLGIGISVCGLLLMAATGQRSHDGRAISWALAAMLATSVYSISDKAATAQMGSFGALVGFITFGYFTAWAAMTVSLRRRLGRWSPPAPMPLPAMLLGALCIGLAYALVIHAMRFIPAAEAVAYSNAGIVIASLLSIALFKERAHWQKRLLGGVIICAGLLVLAFGRT
jgi:phosphonate utilization associated putative membrane protein